MKTWLFNAAAWTFGLAIAITPCQEPAYALTMEEQTVYAALTLNVIRFTTWPPNTALTQGNALNLCVVGDNVVQEAFASIDSKAVGDKTIKIINLSRLRGFNECKTLYISQIKNNVLIQLLSELKASPILTVGETADFAKLGGMVELNNADGKVTLIVNPTAANAAKININSRILKLAKIVGAN